MIETEKESACCRGIVFFKVLRAFNFTLSVMYRSQSERLVVDAISPSDNQPHPFVPHVRTLCTEIHEESRAICNEASVVCLQLRSRCVVCLFNKRGEIVQPACGRNMPSS